ncbi:polysaccharide deacetylase family protein [Ascidiimonas aurantiaca]|uniref:polysaccharide deacetylase family protein n=1 Tax=Ascidiimonas aurantiaca TaxID=1685432 RepID=UPI0030EF4F4A
MKMPVPASTPWFLKKVYPSLTWHIPEKTKAVYLTFDDGPTPEVTDWVLKELQAYQAKATFFCIGKNVVQHPKLYHKILEAGHRAGNHTFNHLNGWKHDTDTYLSNAEEASQFIDSPLFRPPYGKLRYRQIKKLLRSGYKIIMWDVLSIDWNRELSPDTCAGNVIKNSVNGSIIVFHDSLKAEKNLKQALPKVLSHFKDEGFEFKTL